MNWALTSVAQVELHTSMLDFTELPPDGTAFELLTREILFKLGLRPFWSGKGPDGGRDLLCEEVRHSLIQDDTFLWLVQCKHNAHSGKSVGLDDLGSIVDTCAHHGAGGYLLVCSTYPSSKVVERLEGIGGSPSAVRATSWDAVAIERMLRSPALWPIAQRFFPQSAQGWQLYATEYPNRWLANYAGHYFHIANRIGSGCNVHLGSIQSRLKQLLSVRLPDEHFFRLRAVYYDDKHGAYTWFVDYMHPFGSEPALRREQIETHMGHELAWEDGQMYDFDIRAVEYSGHSDHYDADHYDYYRPFLANFAWGSAREGFRGW